MWFYDYHVENSRWKIYIHIYFWERLLASLSEMKKFKLIVQTTLKIIVGK